MYLRTVKNSSDEDAYEYVRLVESYRESGKVKQRVVCTLGRKDLLAPHLPALIRILRGEKADSPDFSAGRVEAVGAWDWGPSRVAREFFSKLGLWGILDGSAGKATGFADRVFALVANRLCCPTSEHGLARWLETDFVCDRRGDRILPQWRTDEKRLKSGSPRVRVKSSQLRAWYHTLDELLAEKSEIERQLFLRLRTLFSLKADLVFYDITSSYFEGHGPPMAKHGHSRDGKPRNRQVVVGLVLVDGWPIAHHIFEGNKRDAMTVPEVVRDVRDRFGIARMVFVGDRGMVTSNNVAFLREAKQGYVVGLNRRRSERVYQYIESAKGPWQDCPLGIAAAESENPERTRVQEVASDEAGVRVFVVTSEERLRYERTQRESSMERVRKKLDLLQVRIEKGKLRAPEKVGAAATRILGKHHGDRYYSWEYSDGRFRYFEHPVNLPREKAYEGKYVIQTEEESLTPVDAVRVYKELSEVERAFSRMKDVVEMRPIFHKKDERVRAHVFVAALAFLIDRALEKALKSAKLDVSSRESWQLLRTVRVVDIDLGNGQTKRSVTRGSKRVEQILRAIPIVDLAPPTLANGGRQPL
ncbi:MAG: IS1634 family transposase [Planctomycetota bacterium]